MTDTNSIILDINLDDVINPSSLNNNVSNSHSTGNVPDIITVDSGLITQAENENAAEITKENKPKKDKKKKDKKGNKNKENNDQILQYVSNSGDIYGLVPVQAKSKYDVKMHMTNERTFFKYLFASFHLGAMGTFLLQYYSQPSFFKPILIGLIWLTAFSFICVGLYTYYQRRDFLKAGRMKSIAGLQVHGPSYVLLAFLIIFVSIIVYSIDKVPQKTKLRSDNHGTIITNITEHYINQQQQTPVPFTTVLPV